MDRTELAHRRLHALRLTTPPLSTAADVLRWLGAVQSQDFPGGKWAVGQRLAAVTDAQLEHMYNAGALLRTHVLRPTWHFVLPEDIRWMLELTAPRIHATNAHYARSFGVADVLADGQRVIATALERGQHLTRKELQGVLAGGGIQTHSLGLAYVLMHAELNGVICSGAMRGKQHTYALLEARAPNARRLSRTEALAELTRRYFASHGPATTNDFRWWSSLTIAEIKQGLSLLGSGLAQETVNGTTYWFDPDLAGSPAPSPNVLLLQAYDEYIVGYSGESKAVLDLSRAARAQGETHGALAHVLVLDSQVVGRWQRVVDRAEVRLQTQLFQAFDEPAHGALYRAAQRYGAFLGLPVVLI